MVYQIQVTLNKFNTKLYDLCPNIKNTKLNKDIVSAIRIVVVSNHTGPVFQLFKKRDLEIIAYEFDTEKDALHYAQNWLIPLSVCPNMTYDFRAYDDKEKLESKIYKKYPELLL